MKRIKQLFAILILNIFIIGCQVEGSYLGKYRYGYIISTDKYAPHYVYSEYPLSLNSHGCIICKYTGEVRVCQVTLMWPDKKYINKFKNR